jgi:hypothetical protein
MMQCLKARTEESKDTGVARKELSIHAPTTTTHTHNNGKTVGLDHVLCHIR